MINSIEDINKLIKKHDDYRSECLNLIASENRSSNTVRNLLSTDIGNRYGCYETENIYNREYTGNKYITELEVNTQELLKEAFHGKYADLRPTAGHLAGMSVVLGILDPGDLVIEVALEDWGHGLVGPMCQVEQFAKTINVEYMKFNSLGEVDLKELEKQIVEKKPKLVILGGSGTLFPEPIKEVVNIAKKTGTIVAYDAAHVTGLIVGGVFPNPLDEGADVMFGSTHKSFPGPQGGFVVSNSKEIIEKVGNTLSPSLVTSHHLERIPALAAALLEMKKYGIEYAKQIVKNSKKLAVELSNYGFIVKGKDKGYTESHLILVDVGKYIDKAPGSILESANILISDDFSGKSVEIRIGTAEVTRMGMKEEEMKEIASFIKRVLIDKENIESIKEEIRNFVSRYTEVSYSL